MTPARISGLPIAEFCGKSRELSLGSGRSAATSTGFHALASGKPESVALAGLSPEEQAELRELKFPTDCPIRLDGAEVLLRYSEAEKETKFALDKMARPTDWDSPDTMVRGSEDMGWTIEVGGHRIAYSADMKRSEWTELDGPDSLQILGYAFGRAARDSCDMLCGGVWAATEGLWHWGELIHLESDEAITLWDRIVHAATNRGGYSHGAHCGRCWSRLRCPVHMIHPDDYKGGQIDESTPDVEVARLIRQAKAASEAAELVLKRAKWAADMRGGIRDGKQVFRSIQMPGKESVDVNRLLAEVPNAQSYMRQGKPFSQYRWVKA